MTPGSVAAALDRHAAPVLLLRAEAPSEGAFPAPLVELAGAAGNPVVPGFRTALVAGAVMRASVSDLPGGNPQVGRRLIVAAEALRAAGWPDAPRKGDLAQVQGRQLAVLDCAPRRLPDGRALHVLALAG